MVVFGTYKSDDVGQNLYQGTEKECRNFISDNLQKDDFYSLNICEDSGEIKERVVIPELPAFRRHRGR